VPVIAAAVVAPIVVPLIVPPVIVTELAFCDAIVPSPVISELGMDATVVNAVVPLAFKYPAVNVVAPEPPLATPNVPVTPVDKGRPVAFVSVTDVGVPSIGVTNVGDVFNTLLPEPVLVVTPVPPFNTGNMPVTPLVKGKPVAFVNVPELGVPNAPPLTTNAPADPVLTANAVATPVPKPVIDPTAGVTVVLPAKVS